MTTRLAVIIKQCGEDQQLRTLGLVLFEQLGEEYPDTLGSIIAAKVLGAAYGAQQAKLPTSGRDHIQVGAEGERVGDS